MQIINFYKVLELIELHGVPQDMASVDALIHKKDDRVRKEFEKWAIWSSKMTNNIAQRESLG